MSTGLSVKGDKGRWPNRAKRRGALRAVESPKERPSDPVMPWVVRSSVDPSVDPADEPAENLSVYPVAHSLSIRSLCPFCGSSQDPDSACCAEWAATTGASLKPPPRVNPWQRVTQQTAAFGQRLNDASHLLVVLLASSAVALLVSLALRSRVATVQPLELDNARLTANHPAEPLPSLAKEVPPPQPPEPAPAALPPMTVAVAVPPPAEVLPPPLPEPAPIRTEWSAEDVAKWHRLRRGMSRMAVRMIFGYPQWIDRRTTPRTEYWLYTSERIVDGGWIAFFDGDGPVSSWREP